MIIRQQGEMKQGNFFLTQINVNPALSTRWPTELRLGEFFQQDNICNAIPGSGADPNAGADLGLPVGSVDIGRLDELPDELRHTSLGKFPVHHIKRRPGIHQDHAGVI